MAGGRLQEIGAAMIVAAGFEGSEVDEAFQHFKAGMKFRVILAAAVALVLCLLLWDASASFITGEVQSIHRANAGGM